MGGELVTGWPHAPLSSLGAAEGRRFSATGSDRVLTEAATLPTTLHAGVTQSADGTIVMGGTRLQRLMPGQQVFRDVASRHHSVSVQVWPSC